MDKNPKVSIIGLGNILLGDEGFGVHVIHYLERHFLFPKECKLIDGGCAGLKLLDFMRGKTAVFLIDVYFSQETSEGIIRTFGWEEIEKFPSRGFVSNHQVGIREALALARLKGLKPKVFKVFATVPQDISPGIKLSPPLRKLLPLVSQNILDELRRLGLQVISLSKSSGETVCA